MLAAGPGHCYRYTRFGLATRAGAENDVGAALIGLDANRIAMQNWVIATVLAMLSGVLISPISAMDPTSYTLFVVPALGRGADRPVLLVRHHRGRGAAARRDPVGDRQTADRVDLAAPAGAG